MNVKVKWLSLLLACQLASSATLVPVLGAYAASGLDSKDYSLINNGNWQEAATSLEKVTAGQTGYTRDRAWLCFAYLFVGRCEDLHKLVASLGEGAATDEPNRALCQSFDLMCQGKNQEADKLLNALPAQYGEDSLVSFALAAVAGKQGRAADAARLCQRSVAQDPDFAWGYRTLGFLNQRWLRDADSAENAYAKALELEPDLSEARDLLVESKISHNDFDGAIAIADQAIKRHGKDGANHYRLAQIYQQQWRLNEALAEMNRAVKLDPQAARYYRNIAGIKRVQGDLPGAIVDQQKAADLGKDKPFELVELASMNIMAGNNNRAAENLSDALKIDPDNQAAHEKLVKLLTDEKRYGELQVEFERTLKRKPKDAQLHLALANAYLADNKTEKAIAEYVEAANLSPQDPEPHRQVAAIRVRQGDYTQAAKEYTRALTVDPTSVPDLVALGFCYAQSQDYMQSEAAFVTALALQQLVNMPLPAGLAFRAGERTQPALSRTDVIRSLAVLLFREGRYSDAVAQMDAVLASSKNTPNQAVDQFLLSEARALRDLTPTARQDMLKAFDSLPAEKQSEERLALVETLLKIGQPDSALTVVDKVGSDPHALEFKARALRLKGKTEESKTAIADALKQLEASKDEQALSNALLESAELNLQLNDLNAAKEAALKALDANPKSFNGFTILGYILLKQKDVSGAMEAAKKALAIDPYHTQAYLLLGDAQSSQNHYKEASQNYKRAAELYPGLIEAHKSLLQSYRKLAMVDEAKQEEEQLSIMEKRQ